MANAKRDARREAFWRETLRRQAGSGSSVRAFCRREKLAESNFYAWRRTIEQRDRERTSAARHRKKTDRRKVSPAFVPVAIQSQPEHETGIVLERAGHMLKILWWDRDGLAIYYKRLESGTFRFPTSGDRSLPIDQAELMRLLRGLQIVRERVA